MRVYIVLEHHYQAPWSPNWLNQQSAIGSSIEYLYYFQQHFLHTNHDIISILVGKIQLPPLSPPDGITAKPSSSQNQLWVHQSCYCYPLSTKSRKTIQPWKQTGTYTEIQKTIHGNTIIWYRQYNVQWRWQGKPIWSMLQTGGKTVLLFVHSSLILLCVCVCVRVRSLQGVSPLYIGLLSFTI